MEQLKRRRIVQYLVAASVSIASMTLGVASAWPTPVLTKFNGTETGVNITKEEISWMLSLSSPGFMAGSLITSYISDNYGRKTTILGGAVPFVLGSIIILSSLEAWVLYIARILWGWGTGMIGSVAGMYLAEIADKDLRGTLSVGTRFMFNFGTLMAIAVGYVVSYQTLNLSLLILPICFFIACWWIPESPYYYLKEGKVEAAGRELAKLRNYKNKKEIEEELLILKATVNNEMRRDSTLKELFCGANYRKAIVIATGLKTAQIMTGVITIQSYMGLIMQDTQSDIRPETVFIIFGVVKFLVGIMSSVIADHVGRRPLMIYSFFGTAFFFFMTGAFFFCQEVLEIKQEFLSSYGYVAFAGIVGASVVTTLGFGSIIFTVLAEIFPMNVKAVAMSALSIYGGVLAFIVMKSYQRIKDWSGSCGVFWIYSTVAVIGAMFSILYMPETKGKTLREIQILLQGDMYEEADNNIENGKVQDSNKDTELQELNKKEFSRL